MACSKEPMEIGNGVKMLRSQYLAGFTDDAVARYPTMPRLDVDVPAKIDGTIADVFEAHPELEEILFNEVKACKACGKPCASSMFNCNNCGAELPTELTKVENVFTAFLLSVKTAARGFPYKISLRKETEDMLIFDDMLQLASCHFNAIPKKYHMRDFRFLFLAPKEALELLEKLEAELWDLTKEFLANSKWRSFIFKPGVTDEDIKKSLALSFNFPPSQWQLHVQWIVPPLIPFQHYMCELKNHFINRRAIPWEYVKKLLARMIEQNKTYPTTKETTIDEIFEYAKKEFGLDYDKEWAEWYEANCVQSTLAFQNWKVEDFKYVVEDGKVYNFEVVDGTVELRDELTDLKPTEIQAEDKLRMQNYGRPYDANGKPSGTYIQEAVLPKFGEGGFKPWPPQ